MIPGHTRFYMFFVLEQRIFCSFSTSRFLFKFKRSAGGHLRQKFTECLCRGRGSGVLVPVEAQLGGQQWHLHSFITITSFSLSCLVYLFVLLTRCAEQNRSSAWRASRAGEERGSKGAQRGKEGSGARGRTRRLRRRYVNRDLTAHFFCNPNCLSICVITCSPCN